jgi:GNAT superfamily N-acetyltransferase
VTDVRIRPARPGDAAVLAEMANDLNEHVGIHTRPFTTERVRQDVFGPEPVVTPLVAELDGRVVGYAWFAMGYNTDFAGRSMWLHDLFVTPGLRGRGIGRALLAEVAAAAVRGGAVSVEWGVQVHNADALKFYRGLGAVEGDVRLMFLTGDRLRDLAAATR